MVSFGSSDVSNQVASERLYLNRDGDRIVAEGDPEAYQLVAAKGTNIPQHILQRFGSVSVGATAKADAAKSDATGQPVGAVGDDVPAASTADDADSKSRKSAPSNKAVDGPPADKGTDAPADAPAENA